MAEINVGLLECTTPERYEQLGRMVCAALMRDEAKRSYIVGTQKIVFREITVSGS